jgi:hypothetical protein
MRWHQRPLRYANVRCCGCHLGIVDRRYLALVAVKVDSTASFLSVA